MNPCEAKRETRIVFKSTFWIYSIAIFTPTNIWKNATASAGKKSNYLCRVPRTTALSDTLFDGLSQNILFFWTLSEAFF